jgi:hypothetical protein
MISDGGAAIAVGTWYQSMGGFVSVTTPWEFSGAAADVHGESFAAGSGPRLELLLEYFDMDAARRSSLGLEYIQFKVSAQMVPPPFGLEEVREIMRNATQAILRHERRGEEPVIGFMVASNRPIGDCFQNLAELAREASLHEITSESIAAFGKTGVPSSLFPKKRDEREKSSPAPSRRSSSRLNEGSAPTVQTMRELAESITWHKSGEYGYSRDQCTNACLTALARFAFVNAHPAKLVASLRHWLGTWGILPDERDRYISSVLGVLQSRTLDGKSIDPVSVMRALIGRESAVSLRVSDTWPGVIEDLSRRTWHDPPTPQLTGPPDVTDWMIDRSRLLEGLPRSYSPPTSLILAQDHMEVYSSSRPRIFVIVGRGGVGKSSVMAHLFNHLAGEPWNWLESRVSDPTKLLGYPIISETDVSAIEGIARTVERWGRRPPSLSSPIERLAIANGVSEAEPVVWLGLDGLDEILEAHLSQLARSIAQCARDHPNLRVVLTTRPGEFALISSTLNSMGLMARIEVEEFDSDEAREAVKSATDMGIYFSNMPVSERTIGSLKDGMQGHLSHSAEEFLDSIRQPMYVGVIRTIFLRDNGLSLIQAACNGDCTALAELAKEYTYAFCERAHRRLNSRHISREMLLRALKLLAANVPIPSEANHRHWSDVCRLELNGHINWGVLHGQCCDSGLIVDRRAGAFEWRHPSVRRCLPDMDGSTRW